MWRLSASWFVICTITIVQGDGLLLLHRPHDISHDCAFSQRLRYDLSFGMGMSDTITLVFRTLSETDYVCTVEITSEPSAYILVVIRFPNPVKDNCLVNENGFIVLKKDKCIRLCDVIDTTKSKTPYYTMPVKGRLRFRFLSNSSINSDIDAHLYQMTATTARLKPELGCNRRNETSCVVNEDEFCFTSGVVCDGIKNCGVPNWFDERKSKCGLPVDRLGIAPVIAVVAAILCALLGASHILLHCLPPSANSYFIFNANDDNRLCIDTVSRSPGPVSSDTERTKRTSLIPVSPSSSSPSTPTDEMRDSLEEFRRLSRLKSITAKMHEKFLTATGLVTNEDSSTNVVNV